MFFFCFVLFCFFYLNDPRQNYQVIKAWKNAFTKQRQRVSNVIIIILTTISTRKDAKLNYCQRKVANN